MHHLLPSWPLLTAFLFASIVLAVTPGPAVFYIVTRTMAQGRRAGLASVAGVAFGNLGNAIGASIGLAALFAISSLAFTVVKYAGAAYLVYLGIQALRTKETEVKAMQFGAADMKRIFRDGFVVALLNPKTTIFFAAFLPQFMDPAAAPMVQSVALGALFVAVAATTDCIYTFAASMLAPAVTQLRGARAFGRYLAASAFIGLGVFTAATGSRSSK
ncbi:LysE family translocator [Noviherbaspirillum cavernae]|uniref:LysE family translocator n=1 Tax=Noviherbaspirillum cavernae TaxID=2320862 RepID=A0A418X3J2_9BURK|nr:LysE family translocator [Noviherbaspirillum cavernae]RJG07019.1 LysE family translocator [Noviherbaspirillum cavernae]